MVAKNKLLKTVRTMKEHEKGNVFHYMNFQANVNSFHQPYGICTLRNNIILQDQ